MYPPRIRSRPDRAPTRRITALAPLCGIAILIAQLAPLAHAQTDAQDETEAGTLSVDVSEARDTQIRDALIRRLSTIKGLDTIEVDVDAGVVTLRGVAASSEAARDALALARRTEGVATVQSEIIEDWSLDRRLRPALEEGRDRLQHLVSYLPVAAVALGLVVLFAFLARLVGRWDALYARLARTRFVQDQLRQAARVVVFVIGVLIALELLNATALVGAVLGAAGVAGLALGFAFRDLVENHIASVLLSVRQPFAPNDHVVIASHEGKVIRLTSRATVLMTLDGNHLRIPNADVFKGVILNYSRNPHRSFSVTLGIGMNEDLRRAQRIGESALKAMDAVESEPPPAAFIERIGASSVDVSFVGWVDQRQHNFFKVKGEAIRQVKEALDEGGIDLPDPIYRVHVMGAAAAEPPQEPAPRAAPPREGAAPVDLAAGDSVDDQIARERAETTAGDLLDPRAPKE